MSSPSPKRATSSFQLLGKKILELFSTPLFFCHVSKCFSESCLHYLQNMSRICLLPFTTFPTYPHPHPGPAHQLLLPGNIAAPLVTLHPLSPQSVLSRASRVIFLKSKSEPVPLLLKNRVGTHLTQRKGSFKDPRASDQCSALPSHFSPPPHSIYSSHCCTGRTACFCLRTFALTIAFAWNNLFPDPYSAFSLILLRFFSTLHQPIPPGSPSPFPRFAYLSGFYHHLI